MKLTLPLKIRPSHAWLCHVLLFAAACGWAGATEAPPGTYPASLPPEALARAAIATTPMTELARLSWQGEQAQARQLRAGSYEWTARAAIQRRIERTGSSFTERELGLERGVRWSDKVVLDNRLAEAGIAAAVSGYEDAWHESARTLLKAWFDTAREEGTVHSLNEQVDFSRQQLSVVQRRVAAGDAPRLEMLLAQGEVERSEAALSGARLRAQGLRVELDRRYPPLRALKLSHQHLETLGLGEANPSRLGIGQDAASLEQAILAENHEVELAKANTELARLRFERSERDRRADPTVGLRYAQERGGQENIVGISIAIPFGGAARDTRAQLAAIEAGKAEARQREVLARVGYEATRAAQAVAQSRWLADQLTGAARKASTAAELTAKAYAEGETPLASLLQARRQAGEARLAAMIAQVTAEEASARALLDAHQLWTPTPLDNPQE